MYGLLFFVLSLAAVCASAARGQILEARAQLFADFSSFEDLRAFEERQILEQASSNDVDLQQNDINGLQYALALEHLEAAFYSQYLAIYNNQLNYTNAPASSPARNAYPGNTFAYLQLIAAHELAHVKFLQDTIRSIDSSVTPVPACTYNFGTINNVNDFLDLAVALEDTGVAAYDGAITAFTSEGLRQGAATIATVEARHAAWLRTITGATNGPFPANFDATLTPAQVLSTQHAGAFISSCPGNYDPTDNLPLSIAFSEDNSPAPDDGDNSTALSVSFVVMLVSALFWSH
jgi:hypothetical protein